MSDRRVSSRSRKQVDYSVAGESNFEDNDDDEDFAVCSRGPPAKKLRTAKEKTTEKPKTQNPEQATSSKSYNKPSKERRALGDRLFERDLELAMSLSKTPSSDPKGNGTKPVSVGSQFSSAPNSIEAKTSQSTDSAAEKEAESVQLESCFEEIQHETEDESASAKKDDSLLNGNKAVLSDCPSASETELSEDDDNGSDSSSSFDSRQGRRTKTQAASKMKAKAKPSTRPTKSAKTTLEKLNSTIIAPASLGPSARSTTSRSHPPKANAGVHSKVTSSDKRPSYSSPTSGGLRIGLSRNVKVKPLHHLHSPTSNSIRN